MTALEIVTLQTRKVLVTPIWSSTWMSSIAVGCRHSRSLPFDLHLAWQYLCIAGQLLRSYFDCNSFRGQPYRIHSVASRLSPNRSDAWRTDFRSLCWNNLLRRILADLRWAYTCHYHCLKQYYSVTNLSLRCSSNWKLIFCRCDHCPRNRCWSTISCHWWYCSNTADHSPACDRWTADGTVLPIEVRALFGIGPVHRLDYLAPLWSLCRSDLRGVTAAGG